MSFQSHPNLFMVLFFIIIIVEMNNDELNSKGHKFHIWAMGGVCIVFGLEHQRGAMQRKSRRFHHPRQFQPRHKMRLLLQQLHHLPHHPTVSTRIFSDGAHLIIHHQIRFPFALLIDEINFSVPVLVFLLFLFFSFFYFFPFSRKVRGLQATGVIPEEIGNLPFLTALCGFLYFFMNSISLVRFRSKWGTVCPFV